MGKDGPSKLSGNQPDYRTMWLGIHDWAADGVRTIGEPGPILSMARHPNGQHVATVNANWTIYILRIPELAEHAKQK